MKYATWKFCLLYWALTNEDEPSKTEKSDQSTIVLLIATFSQPFRGFPMEHEVFLPMTTAFILPSGQVWVPLEQKDEL